MAEKKTEKKAEKKLERTYIIPIRKSTVKTARWRRAKKAIAVIRKFMKRHMKSENLKIGQELNEIIWARGGKYVPGKIEIKAVKDEGLVRLNVVGAPLPGAETKKEVKKTEKKEEAKTEAKTEVKTEEKAEPEQKSEEKKEEVKTSEETTASEKTETAEKKGEGV